MLVLQKLITQKFKQISQISSQKQFFNISGVDKAKFPLIVVNFPSTEDIQNRQNVNIEIDIWYSNKANTIISAETIIDKIDEKLRKLNCTIDNVCISVDRQNIWKLSIPDVQDDVLRKQLKYTAKVYL